MASGARTAEWRCETERTLAALTTGLASVREPRHVRQHFEESLRGLLGAASVTFCEDGEPFERPDSVSCELPVAGLLHGRPCLIASFDARRPVNDRARQILAAAAHVAGLLLEMERASGRWPLAASRPDGAAPLIGSSGPIRAVRDRIERIAGTDFTVLIEGPSRR